MQSPEVYQILFDYHHTLYNRVWESVAQLSPDQFLQEIPYSRGSIRNQLIHVANTDGGWLRGIKEIPGAREFRLDPDDYPDYQTAREVWDAIADEMNGFLEKLDEHTLMNVPQGMSGPTWQILSHLVNHGTDHRAQILRAMDEFGAPTFDQDMIFFFWSHD